MGCGRTGAHGNSETGLIRGLMNSTPPVGKAMPDLCVLPRRFRAQMLSACILSAEKSREGLGSVTI